MPASLSAEQTESYRNNGYLFPLPLFNRLHVQMILEEYAEARRQAEEPADPINPQRVFRSLSEQLPDDAILCGDSG